MLRAISASSSKAGPQPDFDRFCRHLKRQSAPGPVPVAEFFADTHIIERLIGKDFPAAQTGSFYDHGDLSREEQQATARQFVDLHLEFCNLLGLDYLFLELDLGLPRTNIALLDDDFVKGGKRAWISESDPGLVQKWEDFDRLRWPRPAEVDFSTLDYACGILPEGMKILILPSGGIFEEASWMMGLTDFCLAIYDHPDLVQALLEKIGGLILAAVKTVVEYEQVGGIWLGDDLAFNTGTFVNPQWLRESLFPHYRDLVDLAHRHGKVFFLHSCGNLGKIMDDLIQLGFDAKHSFEDKIQPVERVYQQWGVHIGIIGGLDMDLLARGSPQAVRQRTREILEVCGPRGGYALGTGNSLADYVRVDNYLAMLEEGRRWNAAHFGS